MKNDFSFDIAVGFLQTAWSYVPGVWLTNNNNICESPGEDMMSKTKFTFCRNIQCGRIMMHTIQYFNWTYASEILLSPKSAPSHFWH
jgi:hypothetical protein